MDLYLATVRSKARAYGYPRIDYATDSTHKFQVRTPEGRIRRFGRRGMMDYILWKEVERNGEVPLGTAEERRRLYLARATAIRGKWAEDDYSPNMLAIRLLW